MSEQEKQQRIDDYLNRQLTAAEREAMENALATDADLRSEVNLQQAIGETLGDAKRRQLAQVMQQTDAHWQATSSSKNAPIVSMPLWKKIAAVAAICLLSLTIWQVFFTRPVSTQDLFATHFTPYAMVLTQRSDNQLNPATLQTAIDNYAAKNYALAATQFATLAQQQPKQPLYRLYECVAQLATTATPTTANCFMDLQQYPNLQQQATWYLGLTYLEQGEVTAARRTFQQISAGQFKATAATAILRQLQ